VLELLDDGGHFVNLREERRQGVSKLMGDRSVDHPKKFLLSFYLIVHYFVRNVNDLEHDFGVALVLENVAHFDLDVLFLLFSSHFQFENHFFEVLRIHADERVERLHLLLLVVIFFVFVQLNQFQKLLIQNVSGEVQRSNNVFHEIGKLGVLKFNLVITNHNNPFF
jgi:hypothetical protein